MAKNTALAAYKAGERSRRRGKSHRPKTTIPLAIVAGFVPTAGYALAGFRQGGETGITEGIARLTARMTGYSITENKWHWNELAKGWAPVVVGVVVHKLANKFGLNQMLARMGVPLVRI